MTKPTGTLRMRVFAGPNGSGKTTIINEVRKTKVGGKHLDFGIYVNADEIADQLRTDTFKFASYTLNVTAKQFKTVALKSGLINDKFTQHNFSSCYSLSNNKIKLRHAHEVERLAQIAADFLRKRLIEEKKKFSFETVFSHPSKVDIMRDALLAGYKVYLYFVSTESPEINKYRVDLRVKNGGHGVDPALITQRYYRALDLLFDAAQLSYQAYFIDNSMSHGAAKWFAHFKVVGDKKNYSAKTPHRRPKKSSPPDS